MLIPNAYSRDKIHDMMKTKRRHRNHRIDFHALRRHDLFIEDFSDDQLGESKIND